MSIRYGEDVREFFEDCHERIGKYGNAGLVTEVFISHSCQSWCALISQVLKQRKRL